MYIGNFSEKLRPKDYLAPEIPKKIINQSES
jgi:hypothetical protein